MSRDTTLQTPARVALCAPGELFGGVERFIDTLARYFTKAGVPVVVVTLFDGPLSARLQGSGIPVFVVAGSHRYDPTSVVRMARLFRQHRINLVHTHGYKATILGAVAARLTGARLVRTEHGRLEPAAGYQRLKMWLNTAVETQVSRFCADAVVFVSDDVQRQSKSVSRVTSSTVIYNGIEATPVVTSKALADFDEAPGLFNLGIVGRVVEVKGHEHLLRALQKLQRLPNLRLYVFGEGPLEPECRRFAEQHLPPGVVRFMGFRDNIQDYFNRLQLLVMPSLHEGLPYTLLEAMCHRVPVIASNVGGLPEVITDRESGLLVPAGDSEQLALAIERVYKDDALRGCLASRGYDVLCERFRIETMARRYLETYDTVLARSGAGPVGASPAIGSR